MTTAAPPTPHHPCSTHPPASAVQELRKAEKATFATPKYPHRHSLIATPGSFPTHTQHPACGLPLSLRLREWDSWVPCADEKLRPGRERGAGPQPRAVCCHRPWAPIASC